MNTAGILRFLVCLFFFGFSLYSYIDKQNGLTALKMQLPQISKEIRAIQEENTRLQYEIDQFENPEHLMQLAQGERYSHLKYPFVNEVVTLPEPLALKTPPPLEEEESLLKPKVSLAIGVAK
jgi:hypothetical protein